MTFFHFDRYKNTENVLITDKHLRMWGDVAKMHQLHQQTKELLNTLVIRPKLGSNYTECDKLISSLSTTHGKLRQILDDGIYTKFNNLLLRISGENLGYHYGNINGHRKRAINKDLYDEAFNDDDFVSDAGKIKNIIDNAQLENVLIEVNGTYVQWPSVAVIIRVEIISDFIGFLFSLENDTIPQFDKIDETLKAIYQTCLPIMKHQHMHDMNKTVAGVKRSKKRMDRIHDDKV